MRFSLIFIALLSSISTHTLANEQADEKSYLTIIPNHNPQLIRNFNPFINSRLHTARDFIYEPLVIFNELKAISLYFVSPKIILSVMIYYH